MDLKHFYERRLQLQQVEPQYRQLCKACLQPQFGCYCEHIQKIETHIKFVILIHPIEVKRRIATGRMAHLCMQNSELIMGQNYTCNARVNDILHDSENHPLLLYPGKNAVRLDAMPQTSRTSVFAQGKKPVVFVIDGTWATARKTMAQSQNLKTITQICFTPRQPSTFRVRKQPAPECYSTIEAIHYTIDLLNARTPNQVHDRTDRKSVV